MSLRLAIPSFLLLCSSAIAQSVAAPFDASYHVVDLGQINGFAYYGGLAFPPGNPNMLVATQYGSTAVRSVPLVRDALNHITGQGATTIVATIGDADGGLAYGPGNVLFFTWYADNRLGQILPGSSVANRLDDLDPLGVVQSVGGCAFVPAGLPGAGSFKLCSYTDSRFYDVTLTADGSGTYAPVIGAWRTLQGGLEGLVYVPNGSGAFAGKLLVAEWDDDMVSAWDLDANGDPVLGSRQTVIAGINGPAGGAVDPLTGDVLFRDVYGRIIALRSGASVGAITIYGSASGGASGTPAISGSGSAHIGNTVTLHVHHAPFAIGVLAYGSAPADVNFLGLRVLTIVDLTFLCITDPAGNWSVPLSLPPEPTLGTYHFYWQAAFLDSSTLTGLVASEGLDLLLN